MELVPFSDFLALTINDESRVDIIYFDFANAFDSVNHDIILHKLKHQYGIDGTLLKFLTSYLQGRVQQVVIGGSKSGSLPVLSGVPQGSILGPILFVLFINDMFNCISIGINIALYADDTKIWRRTECDQDHIILQNDINALLKWSKDNKMVFILISVRYLLSQTSTYSMCSPSTDFHTVWMGHILTMYPVKRTLVFLSHQS